MIGQPVAGGRGRYVAFAGALPSGCNSKVGAEREKHQINEAKSSEMDRKKINK